MDTPRKLTLLKKLAERGPEAKKKAAARKAARSKAKKEAKAKAKGQGKPGGHGPKQKAPVLSSTAPAKATPGFGRKMLNFAKTKAGIAAMLTAGVGTGLAVGLPFAGKGKKKKKLKAQAA